MTDNEEEFFGRLVVALPDHYVFPQVAMSAMLQPASTNGRTAHSDRLRIAQQQVDYVVCTKSCEIVAVVELDDRTHSQTKDQLRDSRLEQAGIRTVRFQSRNKPNGDVIRKMVLGMASRRRRRRQPSRHALLANSGGQCRRQEHC
jgi:very-short-patch-repair endonuclease